jgi:hypothetical protein
MQQTFEAWQIHDDECIEIVFGSLVQIAECRRTGELSDSAKLIHRLTADTYENAMSEHHRRMGWEPYKPMGEAKECPNECGSFFYPLGSGECPNCGPIC